MKFPLSFDLNLLSKHRLSLMGVASIAIIMCHAPGNGVLLPGSLEKIFGFGNIGVDIFLFLSGIGLWFSLSSLSIKKVSLSQWYLKRLTRVFIPYWFMVVPWLVYKVAVGDFGVGRVMGNLMAYDYWLTGGGAWFVSLIIPLYIIAPILYRLINYMSKTYGCAIIVFLCLGLCFARELTLNIDSIRTLSNVLDRIPAFLIGILVGKYVKNGTSIRFSFIIVWIICYFLYSRLFPHCLAFWLYIIPFLSLLSILFNGCERISVVPRFFGFMGEISLESYLSNIFLGNVLMGLTWIICGCDKSYGHYLEYLVVIIGGILWATLSNRISKIFIQKVYDTLHC